MYTNCIKVFVGGAYCSIPAVFAKTGLFGGILLYTTILLLNVYTMMGQVKVADLYHNVQSYPDLVERVYGTRIKPVITLFVIVAQAVFCILFLFMICEVL